MNRRVRVGLSAGVLGLAGLTGCVHNGEWSIEKVLGWEPTNKVKSPDASKYPKPNLQVAERVEAVGRRVIAQNTFTGLDPLFHTIGVQEPILFHRGTAELFVSEGVANRCRTDAELAAVLCSELGRMMAEQQAAKRVGRNTDPIPDVPFPGADGGVGGPDQTRLAELAYHEKRYGRTQPGHDTGTTAAADPDKLARDLLKGAGFDPADLDRSAPLIREAARGDTLRKQMAGSAPAPTWQK